MWLAFALSRRWPPYAKWRAAAFRSLPFADGLAGHLATAVAAPGWRDRESGLASACELLLGAQRAIGLPAPGPAVTPFWDRPYRAIDPALPQALLSGIADPAVSRLPAGVGSIEQWIDNTDILAHPARRREFAAVYRDWSFPYANEKSQVSNVAEKDQ